MITWKDVLEELSHGDGQITDYGRHVGQILFNPTFGRLRSGERIESETFSVLRDRGWIFTEDQGEIKRYTISEAGVAYLDAVMSGRTIRLHTAGSR